MHLAYFMDILSVLLLTFRSLYHLRLHMDITILFPFSLNVTILFHLRLPLELRAYSISVLISTYHLIRQLRSSSDTSILCIPTIRTHSLGQRSFSFAAPAVWNTLPYKIRSSNTISSFRSSLIAYLFQQSC